jgi:hypothetical protein
MVVAQMQTDSSLAEDVPALDEEGVHARAVQIGA